MLIDLKTGQQVGPMLTHSARGIGYRTKIVLDRANDRLISFHTRAALSASASTDTVKVWDLGFLSRHDSAEVLRQKAQSMTGIQIDSDGQVTAMNPQQWLALKKRD